MKTCVAYELSDYAYIAQELLKDLSQCKVLVFSAEMGVGKTTFIQYILKAMGIQELEGSPTYPIVLMYDSEFYGSVAHIDVYRLNDIEEALNVGIEELYYNGTLCLVEWGERFKSILPNQYVSVQLYTNEQGHRVVNWEMEFLN